jgi:hypothetical protein
VRQSERARCRDTLAPGGPEGAGPHRGLRLARLPPRLPEQPIFYPVLNEEYATQIARDWNAASAATGYRGYVTRFEVRAGFLARYDVHTVGASWHREYWIPAEDLEAFNAAIVGPIEIVATFHGAPENPGQTSEDDDGSS